MKVKKQEIPSKDDLRSRTIDTKKLETRLSKEREEEFYRLKNMQVKLSPIKPKNKINFRNSREYSEGESEENDDRYFTQWERQINGAKKPTDEEQKRILARLLKGESSEPENIIKTSMNLNKHSLFLMNKKEKEPMEKKEIPDKREMELGDTHEILEFCEKRIEKYSQEKEELWGKLNQVTSELSERTEEVEELRKRERKIREEKRDLEDRLGELEVDIGREIQEKGELQMELKSKNEELEEMKLLIDREKGAFDEQKQSLSEAVDRINGEKREVEENAEKINQKNLELQEFIDNQEVSLGRLLNSRKVQANAKGEFRVGRDAGEAGKNQRRSPARTAREESQAPQIRKPGHFVSANHDPRRFGNQGLPRPVSQTVS